MKKLCAGISYFSVLNFIYYYGRIFLSKIKYYRYINIIISYYSSKLRKQNIIKTKMKKKKSNAHIFSKINSSVFFLQISLNLVLKRFTANCGISECKASSIPPFQTERWDFLVSFLMTDYLRKIFEN